MLEKHANDLNVVIKHFPLRMHKFAHQASIAALAAARQGKYLELSREMFKNYRQLSEDRIKAQAKAVGIDLEKFAKDRQDKSCEKQIRVDMQLGQKVKVRGVPKLYINGRSVKNRSLRGMSKMVEEELQKK